jgi:hypothetical protein
MTKVVSIILLTLLAAVLASVALSAAFGVAGNLIAMPLSFAIGWYGGGLAFDAYEERSRRARLGDR